MQFHQAAVDPKGIGVRHQDWHNSVTWSWVEGRLKDTEGDPVKVYRWMFDSGSGWEVVYPEGERVDLVGAMAAANEGKQIRLIPTDNWYEMGKDGTLVPANTLQTGPITLLLRPGLIDSEWEVREPTTRKPS